jgi:hypothetical protein
MDSLDIGSSLKDQLTGLRTRVSDLEHGGIATQNDRVSDKLKALNQRVSDLPDTSSSEGPTASTIRHINVVQQRIKDMEGRRGEHGFILSEHSFSSFAELKDWVKEKEVLTCRVYWDLFSIMVTMGPGQLSGQARADKEYSSYQTKSTVFENDLLAAMTHEKPSCLYGKESGALSTQKEAFGACPNYNEWIGIGGSESHKATLDSRVSSFIAGI